jgi:hypothetical protein
LAHNARAFGIRRKSGSDPNAIEIYFHDAGEAGGRAVRKIRELLGLDPKAKELVRILVDFASCIDVPSTDAAEGRVFTPDRSAEQLRVFPPLLRVHTGETAPPDAYTAVHYRGRWFWIDDRDPQSNRALSALLLLFSLTETSAPQSAPPLVTVPVR